MAEQSGSSRKIERLKKGDKERTARHADVMNELIDQLNAWGAIKVSPDGGGKFIFSDANVILQLAKNLGIPDPPGSGTYWLAAIDGVVSWQPTTTDCP